MDIIQEIISALRTHERVMVATIVGTSGSTPASALSKMLITPDRPFPKGTIGGGCLEGDVLQAAKRLHAENRAEVLRFHLTEDEMVQGLICGGTVDVLVEPVGQELVSMFLRIQERRLAGDDTLVVSYIRDGGIVHSKFLLSSYTHTPGEETLSSWVESIRRDVVADRKELSGDIRSALLKAASRQEPQRVQCTGGELILEPVTGRARLIIVGGGHVSRSISRIASMAGFGVTVLDDRAEYANAERFPEADATRVVDFHNAFAQTEIGPSTAIIIVTRGHRSDEEVLERVVDSAAGYIGMIGSKRKVLATYRHLVERGTPPESLRRIHAPMGLEIGAVTPEEIAVSVVAELVQIRRNAPAPVPGKSVAMQPHIKDLKG